MAEYYIKSFQDYLETLCTQHQGLLHQVEPGGKKSFIRFHSPDDINQVLNNPGANLVIVSRYYGKAIGTMDDQMLRQYIQIRFASYAAQPLDGDITGAITTAVDNAFTIMLDFIGRMFNDLVTGNGCDGLHGIELDQCNWDEIPEQPFLEHHFGWDLTIPFRSSFPGHNESVWIV